MKTKYVAFENLQECVDFLPTINMDNLEQNIDRLIRFHAVKIKDYIILFDPFGLLK